MYALIGRVEIKPGKEEETRSMIGERGVAMLQGMAGSAGGYWARTLEGDIIQHSFWLFDTRRTLEWRRHFQFVADSPTPRDVRQRRRVRGHRPGVSHPRCLGRADG